MIGPAATETLKAGSDVALFKHVHRSQ